MILNYFLDQITFSCGKYSSRKFFVGFFFGGGVPLVSDNHNPVFKLSLRDLCFCLVTVGHISALKAFRDKTRFLHV